VLTRAAVLYQVGDLWQVTPVELDGPEGRQVRVRMAASGLCRSDTHIQTGDMAAELPMVGGHEGAGVVEEVGPDVRGLVSGDHVILTFVPSCGQCPPCVAGLQHLCESGADTMGGVGERSGRYRAHAGDAGLSLMCQLGAFSEQVVVDERSLVRVDRDLPLELAALLSCGVCTGWGAAVRTAAIRSGETVVVVGCGGVGMNAVQGARLAGALNIVAVEPQEWKRKAAVTTFGATHSAPDVSTAQGLVQELTHGRLADAVIFAASLAEGELIGPMLDLVGKRGRLVVVAIAPANQRVVMSTRQLTLYERQIRGSLFGSGQARSDFAALIELYRRGHLLLDELITHRYPLDQINQAYSDLDAGEVLRGLVVYGDTPEDNSTPAGL
jgi:S-(hydroxymethyl)glutathione dehydrogenase/alcohol dehydrogenase